MIAALDVTSTFMAGFLLYGLLRRQAPNWHAGALGAVMNVLAALAVAWPIIRMWTPTVGGVS